MSGTVRRFEYQEDTTPGELSDLAVEATVAHLVGEEGWEPGWSPEDIRQAIAADLDRLHERL